MQILIVINHRVLLFNIVVHSKCQVVLALPSMCWYIGSWAFATVQIIIIILWITVVKSTFLVSNMYGRMQGIWKLAWYSPFWMELIKRKQSFNKQGKILSPLFPPITGAGKVWTLRIQGEKRNTWDICFLESNISAHSLLDNQMVNKKSVKLISVSCPIIMEH